MSRPASTGGSVVSLSGRPRYRADFAALASAQVRAARERLGMDYEGFASYLGDVLGWPVMAGWVARWEDGTGTPPGDVVLATAPTAQAGPAEGVIAYDDRGLITRRQWNDIIRGSARRLWLYGMAEHGYAEDDEVPGIIADATAAGCEVRVLLLDPAYPEISNIDAAEGKPAGALAARITASMARFATMRVQVRSYSTNPSVSIVRGDDEMLVTPYLRYFPGDNSPTFGVTEQSAPRMFGRYARHFESMWDLAREAA